MKVETKSTWYAAPPDDYKVIVTIDPQNIVDETYETDNEKIYDLNVLYDSNEPENDIPAGATEIKKNGLIFASQINLIYHKNDVDWYWLDVTGTNKYLHIELESPLRKSEINDDGKKEDMYYDYNFEVYDESLNLVDLSITQYSTDYVNYDLKNKGKYYICVFNGMNEYSVKAPYTLSVEIRDKDIPYGGEFKGWNYLGFKNDASNTIFIKPEDNMNEKWSDNSNSSYLDLFDQVMEFWNNADIFGSPDKIFSSTDDDEVLNVVKAVENNETHVQAYYSPIVTENNDIVSFKVVINMNALKENKVRMPTGFKGSKFDFTKAVLAHELGHVLGLGDLYVSGKYTDTNGNLAGIDNTDKIMFGHSEHWNINSPDFLHPKDIEGLEIIQGWKKPTSIKSTSCDTGYIDEEIRYASASYKYISQEEMYRNADVIVKGTVQSVFDGYNRDTDFYYSTVTLKVDEYYKDLTGNNNSEIVFLQDGNSKLQFKENRVMMEGEEYILFLQKTDSNSLIIMGGPQGRFDIVDTESGPVVQNHFDKFIMHEMHKEGYDSLKTGIEEIDKFEEEIEEGIINVPPEITGTPLTKANANDWYNDDVTVHFEASDPQYGIKSVTPDITITTEGDNQSVTGTAVNNADISASCTVDGINIDKTVPGISGNAVETPNSNGWYNHDVTVSFSVYDNLSGVDKVTPDIVISTEGINQTVTGSVYDKAGNWSEFTVDDINIDKIGPSTNVSSSGSDWTYGIAVSPSFNDVLSGIDKAYYMWSNKKETPERWIEYTGGDIVLDKVGIWYLHIKVVDKAGNETINRYGEYKVSNVRVQMYNGNRTGIINTIFPWFRVYNTGDTPINLKDVKLRYYFTIEDEKELKYWCDWSNIGKANVTGLFVKESQPQNDMDHYFEIGFREAAGILEPGKSVEVHTRIARVDWPDFNQLNDYSLNNL